MCVYFDGDSSASDCSTVQNYVHDKASFKNVCYYQSAMLAKAGIKIHNDVSESERCTIQTEAGCHILSQKLAILIILSS